MRLIKRLQNAEPAPTPEPVSANEDLADADTTATDEEE